MDLTTWAFVTLLTIIGLGIWNGTSQLSSLSYSMGTAQDNYKEQKEINTKQDQEIMELKGAMARQQGVLEEILAAVRASSKSVHRVWEP
jgi:hypothetical protein